MTALVTGASSGIGRAIAIELAKRGYNLIIVARRRQRLFELKREIAAEYGVKVRWFCCDLSKTEDCKALFKRVEHVTIDVLINCAGFGVFGAFDETDLDSELKMIDVNIKAVHILTKLFLRKFKAINKGYILNVASIAGFIAGPEFSSYYASKNYVLQLTKAISEELRHSGSNVYIGAFCPGPVRTEFNEVSGAEFAVAGISDTYAAKYAINHMFRRELVIVPTATAKFVAAAAKLVPEKILLRAAGKVQRSRKTNTPKDEQL